MTDPDRSNPEREPERPISKAWGLFTLVGGLVLLVVFGKILLDVIHTVTAAGVAEPASWVLLVFSTALAGLGAGLIAIGYQRLTRRNRPSNPLRLPVWLLFVLGALFLLAGTFGLLVGSLLWGTITLVLGVSACKLAWQRRRERRA